MCTLYSSVSITNKLLTVVLSEHSIRTPSYQGLKFLSDLLQLKETAILSDSDADSATLHLDSPTSVPACPRESSCSLLLITTKYGKTIDN